MSKGQEIARVNAPLCRCGASQWQTDALGDRTCDDCGTTYTDAREELRELRESEWTRGTRFFVHPTDDPSDETTIITIWMGPDDQLPNHDPAAGFYRPLCVADLMTGGTLYTYLHYCGCCRRKWGSLGTSHGWTHCPYCGAGIANYVFSDGVLDGTREHWTTQLPDFWPEDRVALWDGGNNDR